MSLLEGGRRLSFRLLAVVFLVCLAPMAFANGAMGLALEVFDFQIWAVYVVATVVLEGWIIGRSLHHGWFKSIGLSTLFNFITAFCCAAGFFAPFLHADRPEVNPFLWTLEVLSVYGFFSAVLEACFWHISNRETMKSIVFKRTFLAHLIGVPLAMSILLIPNRPYPGLEADSNIWRFSALLHRNNHIYDDRIDENGNVRQFKTVKEFEAKLDQAGGLGVCLYHAVYRRFDFRDPRIDPKPLELNHHMSEDSTWAARIHSDGRIWELNPFQEHWDLVKGQ